MLKKPSTELSIQLVKVLQQSVLQPVCTEIQVLENGLLKEVQWFLLIKESAWLMSLIKWMNKIEHQFMRLWNSKVFLFQRRVLLRLYKLAVPSLLLLIQLKEGIIVNNRLWIMSTLLMLYFLVLIFSVS